MSHRRGIWYAMTAAALFGASAPIAKALLHDAPPQLLAGLLYAGSGAGLGVTSILRRRRAQASEASLSRRDMPWLLGAIGFGGVVGPVLLMVGLVRTPGSSASLLLNLEGVFTATIAWVVFREHRPGDPTVTDPVPHSHAHRHSALVHSHAHYPDLHHRHGHG